MVTDMPLMTETRSVERSCVVVDRDEDTAWVDLLAAAGLRFNVTTHAFADPEYAAEDVARERISIA